MPAVVRITYSEKCLLHHLFEVTDCSGDLILLLSTSGRDDRHSRSGVFLLLLYYIEGIAQNLDLIAGDTLTVYAESNLLVEIYIYTDEPKH